MAVKKFLALSAVSSFLLLSSCSSPEDYHMGALISTSGKLARYGVEIKRGIDLALEEINMSGGLDGRIIYLHSIDDRSEPEVAVEQLAKLIRDDGITAAIGGISSEIALELAPVAERGEVVLLSPTASSSKLSDAGSFFFRIHSSDEVEAQYMAKFMREKLWKKEFAAISSINEYGGGLKKEFIVSAERLNRRKLGVFNVPDGSGMEAIRETVKSCLELKPESLYIVGYDYDLVKMIKALREADYDGEILTCSRFDSEYVYKELGELADDIFFPRIQYDPGSQKEEIHSFVKKFEEKYKYTPGIHAALGYDALMVLKEALREADQYNGELQQSMQNFGGYSGPTGDISINTKGGVSKLFDIKVRNEGKEMSWEEYKPIFEKRSPLF